MDTKFAVEKSGRSNVYPINSLLSVREDGTDGRLERTISKLIDVMDLAMWELDMNYRIVGSNRKAQDIYGESILGQYCYKVAAKSNVVCDSCPAKLVYDGHNVGRSEHERIDINGKKICVDHIATPVKDKDGNLTGTLVLIVDITERKLLEEEIETHRNHLEKKIIERTRDLELSQSRYRKLYKKSKKAEALYLSLLNSSADAVVIYDLNRQVQYLSPSFTEIFGWKTEELKGENIPFIPSSGDVEWFGRLHHLGETGATIYNFQAKRLAKDGRVLDVYISGSRYADHTGEPAGILLTIKDVTQAKDMEMQLYRAQKFEALGTLAGGIAHDFNNLLMGIQGNLSLLLQDDLIKKEAQQKLGNIEKSVTRGGNLTKQLLGLARKGKYEIKPVNINTLLSDSLDMFGQTKREIVIHSRLDRDLWTVNVDEGQIEQVFLNLFVNAAQAMPTGGHLYISTENVTLDRQAVVSFGGRVGRFVKVVVGDTGSGIEPALKRKIFDPFFTTKDKELGTGLGLASAYGIINNHNSLIHVGDRVGGGAEFTVYLPATTKKVVPARTATAELLLGTETILLVDDEETVIDVTRQLLERLGYAVVVATSGEEALVKYGEHQREISLVILDMIMPGIGGMDVFKQLSVCNPKVQVLLSSGYSLTGQAAEILECGRHGFIQKPFHFHEISKKIREILDSQ